MMAVWFALQTALCRCSQPLGGLMKRSLEDELMIKAIVDANPDKNFMYCVDTRPKVRVWMVYIIVSAHMH